MENKTVAQLRKEAAAKKRGMCPPVYKMSKAQLVNFVKDKKTTKKKEAPKFKYDRSKQPKTTPSAVKITHKVPKATKKIAKPTPPPTKDDFMDVMHVMGERGKQKKPEGRILELSMNREYSDWGLLDYLDENWDTGPEGRREFRDWQSYDEYGNEIWRKRFKNTKAANKEWKKIQNMELGMEYNLNVIKR